MDAEAWVQRERYSGTIEKHRVHRVECSCGHLHSDFRETYSSPNSSAEEVEGVDTSWAEFPRPTATVISEYVP